MKEIIPTAIALIANNNGSFVTFSSQALNLSKVANSYMASEYITSIMNVHQKFEFDAILVTNDEVFPLKLQFPK